MGEGRWTRYEPAEEDRSRRRRAKSGASGFALKPSTDTAGTALPLNSVDELLIADVSLAIELEVTPELARHLERV